MEFLKFVEAESGRIVILNVTQIHSVVEDEHGGAVIITTSGDRMNTTGSIQYLAELLLEAESEGNKKKRLMKLSR